MEKIKVIDNSYNKRIRKWIKNAAKNLLLLLMGCILAFFIGEIFLRIYDPFPSRIKGNKITLLANEEYLIKNKRVKKLDKTITYRTNSLGFRGEEPPIDFKDYLTIITIGGSTTECSLLSEGKTWPDILGMKLKMVFKRVWVNNAGLDGHSTFGHKVLMRDYIIKIKPKIVLFLVGVNDIRKGSNPNRGIKNLGFKKRFSLKSKEFLLSMANRSEVFASVLNIYRYIMASVIGVTFKDFNFNKSEMLELPEEIKTQELNFNKVNFLKGYEASLNELVHIAKENEIDPVLITQSTVFGNGIDDVTNVNLAKVKIGPDRNGELLQQTMELYNGVTRRIGAENSLLVIDLEIEMPKSSRYYLDMHHYTNEGAEKVAEIIYKFLCPFLAKNYDEFLNKDCNILTEDK